MELSELTDSPPSNNAFVSLLHSEEKFSLMIGFQNLGHGKHNVPHNISFFCSFALLQ